MYESLGSMLYRLVHLYPCLWWLCIKLVAGLYYHVVNSPIFQICRQYGRLYLWGAKWICKIVVVYSCIEGISFRVSLPANSCTTFVTILEPVENRSALNHFQPLNSVKCLKLTNSPKEFWICFIKRLRLNTVEPLYSVHHWELTFCPFLWRGVPNSGAFSIFLVGMVLCNRAVLEVFLAVHWQRRLVLWVTALI